MGLREFTNWDIRSDLEDVEPLKKYVFLCEGSNTEVAYFKHLMDIRKKLNVNPLIDYSILERTGLDATVSAPIRLVKYGIQYKNEDNFDSDRDTLIIVFDADFFENKKNEYKKILRKVENKDLYLVLQIHVLKYSCYYIMMEGQINI